MARDETYEGLEKATQPPPPPLPSPRVLPSAGGTTTANADDASDQQLSSSHRDSERTTSTNTTNTTLFSTSSLPSLEGIDMAAALRQSYSSLPSQSDDSFMPPPTPEDESSFFANQAHPLPASPRLPAVVQRHTMSSPRRTPMPSPPDQSITLPQPHYLGTLSNHTLSSEPPRKRARRMDQGPLETPGGTSFQSQPQYAPPPSHHHHHHNPTHPNPLATYHTATTDDGVATTTTATTTPATYQSKHDEKWFQMLEQLTAYKQANGHTMVPQCDKANPRLGRWVHYQRGAFVLCVCVFVELRCIHYYMQDYIFFDCRTTFLSL